MGTRKTPTARRNDVTVQVRSTGSIRNSRPIDGRATMTEAAMKGVRKEETVVTTSATIRALLLLDSPACPVSPCLITIPAAFRADSVSSVLFIRPSTPAPTPSPTAPSVPGKPNPFGTLSLELVSFIGFNYDNEPEGIVLPVFSTFAGHHQGAARRSAGGTRRSLSS